MMTPAKTPKSGFFGNLLKVMGGLILAFLGLIVIVASFSDSPSPEPRQSDAGQANAPQSNALGTIPVKQSEESGGWSVTVEGLTMQENGIQA